MVGHGESSAGLYLADPTSPIPSHCASIVATSTVTVKTVYEGECSAIPHLYFLSLIYGIYHSQYIVSAVLIHANCCSYCLHFMMCLPVGQCVQLFEDCVQEFLLVSFVTLEV